MKRDAVYLAVFVLVLAPVASVVIVSALLLFGVPPPVVFAPGRALRSMTGGPNAIAVATTVLIVWLIVVAIGVVWDRRVRPRRYRPDAAAPDGRR